MANTIKDLIIKTRNTFKDEGAKSLATKAKGYINYCITESRKQKREYKDILFINGCELPHPQRYRVDHQIEQLESFGISCDKVFYADLKLDVLKYYRGFVFFRCPIIPIVEEFIKKAKENNKTCFYDIDDLVFDTQYTDQIQYLNTMSDEDRKLYNDGVKRMGKTMELCEYGITTTNRLKKEMERRMKEVCLNRNVASEAMKKYSDDALAQKKHQDGKIILGYFSGSITHNDDFAILIPIITKLFEKHKNLFLKIVGILDIPPEFERFKDRIITTKFSDWSTLPRLIRSVDINLAPITKTVFNEAKSENKWTEASLVKVPTVASDVGAFKEIIKDGETGFLCKDAEQWLEKLEKLIQSEELRKKVGEDAWVAVNEKGLTTRTGKNISDFIKSKLKPNIFFVVPSCNTSGGILVIMQHASILKKNGYDVTLINAEEYEGEINCSNIFINTVSAKNRDFKNTVDTIVATMWVTLEYVLRFEKCKRRKYLVQNFETDFYKYDREEKRKANSTYNQVPGVEYITISKWCQSWLEQEFKNTVKYAPNGIDTKLFSAKKRHFKEKTKILIEGDSKSHYKNIDESFRIVDKLDRTKYEIHYLSYDGKPKKNYHYDFFYHNIPHSEVAKIYQKCDILLKSSILESFSYPPLEMMATGGFCVVRPNDGNKEYLKDEINCLFYEPNNPDSAIRHIDRLTNDERLRNNIQANAIKTVQNREWKKVEKQIIELYK